MIYVNNKIQKFSILFFRRSTQLRPFVFIFDLITILEPNAERRWVYAIWGTIWLPARKSFSNRSPKIKEQTFDGFDNRNIATRQWNWTQKTANMKRWLVLSIKAQHDIFFQRCNFIEFQQSQQSQRWAHQCWNHCGTTHIIKYSRHNILKAPYFPINCSQNILWKWFKNFAFCRI